jgi:hypothetical protein
MVVEVAITLRSNEKWKGTKMQSVRFSRLLQKLRIRSLNFLRRFNFDGMPV